MLIDGQALVVALGKPQNTHLGTFGDYASLFLNVVFGYGKNFARIDILFDRYNDLTIKEGTRVTRKKGKTIRRVIENPNVPLPHDWQGFLSDSATKLILQNCPLKP